MALNDRHYLTDEYTVSEFPTIPPGTYDATLDGVTSEEHDLYGHRWVWHWTIPEMHPDGGDFELQVWTPPRISSTGMARELAKALGADVAKGAKVDLGALRGRHARLIVTLDEEKGRNRVKGVMPASVATRRAVVRGRARLEAWKAEQAPRRPPSMPRTPRSRRPRRDRPRKTRPDPWTRSIPSWPSSLAAAGRWAGSGSCRCPAHDDRRAQPRRPRAR